MKYMALIFVLAVAGCASGPFGPHGEFCTGFNCDPVYPNPAAVSSAVMLHSMSNTNQRTCQYYGNMIICQ